MQKHKVLLEANQVLPLLKTHEFSKQFIFVPKKNFSKILQHK